MEEVKLEGNLMTKEITEEIDHEIDCKNKWLESRKGKIMDIIK